jgi:hypothetical protein
MNLLVLDENILIRAVLGSNALSLFRRYARDVEFVAPDTAFAEAHAHLPAILSRRNDRIPGQPSVEFDRLTGNAGG